MRMRIANVIACGLIFLIGTACQQQQQVEPSPITPEVAVATPVAKKAPRKNRRAVVTQDMAVAAATGTASIAAATTATGSITPRKPGLRVSRVQTPEMLVALTFDDGPSSAHTPRVLDILHRYGAKGTFFVLGSNAKRCSSIVARAAAEGHEVGVHTWSHINMARSSMSKIDSEVSRTSDVIRSITGKTPLVMRPPYGATTAGIVRHMYDSYGMRSILWDVDTQDWRKPGVSTVINRAVNKAKPGSIILVHDIHASTLAAIEGIVTGLQARGFKLVTVSQLMASVGVHDAPKVTPVDTPEAVEVTPAAAAAVIPAVPAPAVDAPGVPVVEPTPESPMMPSVAQPAVSAPATESLPAEPTEETTPDVSVPSM